MPIVPFDSLPPDARVWVFAADGPLGADAQRTLLGEVDAFLSAWNAHGHPLTCGRAWRDPFFLAIGVDQSTAGASGCSIDGLFRVMQRLQPVIGASMMPSGRAYWREANGDVKTGARHEFNRLVSVGAVPAPVTVFDTSITTAADWATQFEKTRRREDEKTREK